MKKNESEYDPSNSKETLENLRTLIEQPVILPSGTELTEEVKKKMSQLPIKVQNALEDEAANM